LCVVVGCITPTTINLQKLRPTREAEMGVVKQWKGQGEKEEEAEALMGQTLCGKTLRGNA